MTSDVSTTARQPRVLALVLAASALLLVLQIVLENPPAPEPADAPANVFSAGRAEAILRELLAEGVPHPVGTEANRRVKRRIIERLTALGLEVDEQATIGCARRFPVCAFAENVIARLPGREDGRAVLLMAHYDSVPAAPGAGDDGAGVAALLEIARIVASEGPYRNPVMLAFTDAEELGLLGAEAFFGQHPWASEVGVVLNVEGSGSKGPSLLLRTGPGNRGLVQAFHRHADHPVAVSLANEVFKVMPNDTDFSVAMRAGLPGIDFAFAAERNHYHTPLDNIDNLSMATLQHHGENLLPMTRALAETDLDGLESGDDVYHALFQSVFFAWASSASTTLAGVSALLLILAAVFHLRRRTTRVVAIILGGVASILTVVGVVGVGFLAMKAVGSLAGTVSPWPASLTPFRVMLIALALVVGWLVGRLCSRFSDAWGMTVGGWLLWLVLAVATAVIAPGASTLFIIPTLVAGLLIAAGAFVERLRDRPELVAGILALVAVPFSLRVAHLLETTQGYSLIVAVLPFVALWVVVLLPLLLDRSVRIIGLASAAAAVLGLVLCVVVPQFSANRPQHLNLYHLQDADRDEAQWMIVSTNPVPRAVNEAMPFEPGVPILRPWSTTLAVQLFLGKTDSPIATAETIAALGPIVEPIVEVDPSEESSGSVEDGSVGEDGSVEDGSGEDGSVEDGRQMSLRIQSRRGASYVMVLLPESAGLKSWQLEGQNLPRDIHGALRRHYGDYHFFMAGGVPDSGLVLDLDLESSQPVEMIVADWTSQLPDSAATLLDARGELAVPAQYGDQSMVFNRVDLGP